MGDMGLSMGDFCSLTPEEFSAVCSAYAKGRETGFRESWERTRTLAAICIQPHVRGRVTPEKLLPFPWEKGKDTATVSREEDRSRLERLMGRLRSGPRQES